MGLVIAFNLDGNRRGYDITSQNYFCELGDHKHQEITPASHQAISKARNKIDWKAFEFLLHESNLEKNGLSKKMKFNGHVTHAIDGTCFFTPRTEDLLAHFSVRNSNMEGGDTHYPYGLCVTAVNVFTNQPVAAIVDDYKTSERELMSKMISKFNKGDLSLLDRGLGGKGIYFEFQRLGQYFIHRTKTSGDAVAGYVKVFLDSKEPEKTITLKMTDKSSNDKKKIELRLIRGPKDSKGKVIVFVTNLFRKNRYDRKEIMALYEKRWNVETLYNRVKNLLNLEQFRAKTYNGIMQEIFANLLVLSLASIAITSVVEKEEIDTASTLPNFKNAISVIQRHLISIIDRKVTGKSSKSITRAILKEVGHIFYPIRPGRRYPRVSKQPMKKWNKNKSLKIREFEERQNA